MADPFKVSVEINEDLPIDEFLDQLDWELRSKALANALKQASIIVKENAIPRIPRSRETGTSNKKSERQKRADARRKPLADSIDFKIKPYEDGRVFVAIVGPAEESGVKGTTAHAHLVELGHRAYYWSKYPSSRKPFVDAKRWLAPAVDSTQHRQQNAVFYTLQNAAAKAVKKRNKKTKLK